MRLLPVFLLISLITCQGMSLSPAATGGVEHRRLASTMRLQGHLYHVQGVDLDRSHIWITSVDPDGHKGYLHVFDRSTGRLERQIDLTDGPRFHPGGFSLQNGSLWIPVAEYRPASSTVIEEWDVRSLTLKRKILIDDHLGCLAITPDGILAGDWDSRHFYLFDFNGHVLRAIENGQGNHYQDIKFARGILVASGYFDKTSGSIDWYRWPAMNMTRRLRAGVTSHGIPFTAEGMAIDRRDLYLLPEDGPSRLFHFVPFD